MATEACLMCDIKMLHAEKWKLPEMFGLQLHRAPLTLS